MAAGVKELNFVHVGGDMAIQVFYEATLIASYCTVCFNNVTSFIVGCKIYTYYYL